MPVRNFPDACRHTIQCMKNHAAPSSATSRNERLKHEGYDVLCLAVKLLTLYKINVLYLGISK